MKRLLALVVFVAFALFAGEALAQGQGGGPTQSTPTRNKSVGPQRGGDDDQSAPPTSLSEPTIPAPADPLAIPEGVGARIGTDYDGKPPSPTGSTTFQLAPIPQERRGDYRLRLIPPLYLEHTRGLDPSTGADTPKTDTERLIALMFYQRRSPNFDADVLFPVFWRLRDHDDHVLVLGPLAHREAPEEHDNWVAPLFFEGSRKDGGYIHVPPLLLTSHSNDKGAFTIWGPYFRDRTAKDVDWGLVPFYFHGDNGDEDGARRTYSLIPPFLYFHSAHELDESAMTVVGPVIAQSDPKRSVLDVAPLWFSITGRPETGGVKEAHYTLFPLFHYGTSPDETLFVLPGYLRRVTKTVDTMLTPFYSHSTTRSGATSLTFAGPILPVYYRNTDTDIGYSALGIFPFFYESSSPTGETFAIPIFARSESYNVSRTYWVFPSLVYERGVTGWEVDLHPLVYVGRDQDSSHTVLAPVFWDFASKKSRTTIGFPLFWRFADTSDGTITQVAANTLYREKPAVGGKDWQFHLLPLFSYGQSPAGAWWNVLFGLMGYDHDGPVTKIKAFWIPITVSDNTPRAAAPR